MGARLNESWLKPGAADVAMATGALLGLLLGLFEFAVDGGCGAFVDGGAAAGATEESPIGRCQVVSLVTP